MQHTSKRRWSGIVSVFCVLGVWLGGSIALAGTGGSAVHLTIAHGKLTATLDQVTLQTVLEALERHTGIRAEFPPTEAARTLSARVQAVPLVEALRALLAPWNYVLWVDRQGTLRRIIILGQKETMPQRTAQPPLLDDDQEMPIAPAQDDAMQIVLPHHAQEMPIAPAQDDTMQIVLPHNPPSMGPVPGR